MVVINLFLDCGLFNFSGVLRFAIDCVEEVVARRWVPDKFKKSTASCRHFHDYYYYYCYSVLPPSTYPLKQLPLPSSFPFQVSLLDHPSNSLAIVLPRRLAASQSRVASSRGSVQRSSAQASCFASRLLVMGCCVPLLTWLMTKRLDGSRLRTCVSDG